MWQSVSESILPHIRSWKATWWCCPTVGWIENLSSHHSHGLTPSAVAKAKGVPLMFGLAQAHACFSVLASPLCGHCGSPGRFVHACLWTCDTWRLMSLQMNIFIILYHPLKFIFCNSPEHYYTAVSVKKTAVSTKPHILLNCRILQVLVKSEPWKPKKNVMEIDGRSI